MIVVIPNNPQNLRLSLPGMVAMVVAESSLQEVELPLTLVGPIAWQLGSPGQPLGNVFTGAANYAGK